MPCYQDTRSCYQYAYDIVDEKILANKWIKLACQRFLDDLVKQHNPEFKWRFDEEKADKAIFFFSNKLVHVEDKLCGTPLYLEPWQCFFFGNLFGWVSKEDEEINRFNDCVLYVSRKNGKTLLTAGIALLMLIGGSAGQQVFSFATKEAQSRLVWEMCRRMIAMADPKLRAVFETTRSEIRYPARFGIFRPLGRDSKTLDGLNVSCSLGDESAAIMDRNIHEVIRSSQGARKTFLNVQLTTASFDKNTYFVETMERLERVLMGLEQGERMFGVLYGLEAGDDPFLDEECWIKANPNLGVSVSKEWLREEIEGAKSVPTRRAGLLVKNFNVWQGSSQAWLDVSLWRDERLIFEEIPVGWTDCFVTYDLSRSTDLTAVCSWFRYPSGHRYTQLKCFVPEEAFKALPTAYRNIYQRGVDEGVLQIMQGRVIDYREIEEYIKGLYQLYRPARVGYDPYSALQISNSLLESGVPAEEVAQKLSKLSPAAKEFERLFSKQMIQHGKSEFIAWQLQNATIYQDVNDNILVRKDDIKSHHKIDAVSAMITACHLDVNYPQTGAFFFTSV